MKKILVSALVLATASCASSNYCKSWNNPASQGNQDSLDTFISALIWVESRGNDSAYCASEDAVGCLQIRPIMVHEVNRITKSQQYTLEDRWNRECSIEMLEVYFEYYGWNNYEIMARCWNGGPQGYVKSSTEDYWDKVENRMIELS